MDYCSLETHPSNIWDNEKLSRKYSSVSISLDTFLFPQITFCSLNLIEEWKSKCILWRNQITQTKKSNSTDQLFQRGSVTAKQPQLKSENKTIIDLGVVFIDFKQ